MTLIADVFPKLQTPKNAAEKISKKSSFRGHFDKQHAKGDQTLLESEWHNLLPYLLLTVKAIELEKISLSNMQSLKNVC